MSILVMIPGEQVSAAEEKQRSFKAGGYNRVFRQQLTEVFSNYGHITEVWFDGSCIIDVNDILEKYASKSVILQGPKATLRWPGTESGKLFYPAWNTLAKVP